MKRYEVPYHQLKFLCLLSLTLNHAVSWVNQVQRHPLEELPLFPLLNAFCTFAILFIVLAGVSFRLQLEDQVRGSRLEGKVSWGLARYLGFLVLLHGALDVVTYHGIGAVYYWNFFKTIWIAAVLIILLGGLHFGWIAAASVLIFATFDPTRAFLRVFEVHTREDFITQGLETYRFWLGAALALYVFSLIAWIRRKAPTLLRRKGFLMALALVTLAGLAAIAAETPGRHHYELVMNWWIDAWVGNTTFVNYYILGVWLPAALNGFLATHLALRLRAWYERHPWLSFLLALGSSILLNTIAFATISTDGHGVISFWNAPSFQNAYAVTQGLVLTVTLTSYLALERLNSWFPRLSEPRFVEKWSTASFGVYLTVIVVARPIARAASALPLFAAVTVTLLVTLAIAAMVAELLAFAARKKLRLILTKTPS